MSEKSGAWQAKVMGAVVVVLAVAVGARLAWDLLAPLVPILAVGVTLGVVYALALGRARH